MATNFPTGLDTFVDPSATDAMNSATPALKHHTQHTNINDAVAALEAKVGVDSSAVTSSLDYKINHIAAGAPFSGDVFSNGVANTQRNIIGTQAAVGAGSMLLGGFLSGKSFTAANVTVYAQVGGSGATLLRYGIYSLDASGNGTLIASTANQSANVATTGKRTYALQSPVALTAGNAYAIAFVQVGGSTIQYACSFALVSSLVASGQKPFLAAALNSQTDLPASFTFAGLSSFPTNAPYMEITT